MGGQRGGGRAVWEVKQSCFVDRLQAERKKKEKPKMTLRAFRLILGKINLPITKIEKSELSVCKTNSV